ncbi:MAG TPA: hypothetical protein PK218_01890 [Flavobacterium sp.]|jgi:hypothetical protein|nr:hypothetical protein [Flavobacterium sp.]
MGLKTFISLFTFITAFSFAQVGIGTTSPHSQLEIASSNQVTPANTDGVLIPKINTFPATNPTALQQGMLVYLTTTATFASTSRSPGFYYWDNTTTNWIGIQTNPTSNWNLLGNAATSISTNFIGTTDNTDLVIKRNNIRAGYIGNPSTSPFTNANTSFGANSLLNPTITGVVGEGTRNSAFGVNAMPGLTTGGLNTGIGEYTLFSATTGSANTAVGSAALYSVSTGRFNVAVGRNALVTSNGSNNIGIGTSALNGNSSGNNNIAIGTSSFRLNSTGSNNLALGNQAGYNETGSNKLYIEMSTAVSGTDSSENNALIYGEFDNRIVRTNGQLQIGNPTTSGYTFPTTRGTNNQILQTNATGTLSWVNSINNFSLVRANLTANQVVNATGWQKITFNTTLFDSGSEFVTATNRFVANKNGYYEINAGFHTFNKNDTEQYAIAVYKNGVEYQETAAHHYGDKLISRTINCTISLNVNDYIEIYMFNGNAPTTVDGFTGKTYFEVKQIR